MANDEDTGKMEPIMIRVSPTTKARIDALARSGLRVSSWVRSLISKDIDRVEKITAKL